MSFILRRTDQGGGYVAPPGSKFSYVGRPETAQRFDTVGEADSARCPGNEVIVTFHCGSIGPVVTPRPPVEDERCIECCRFFFHTEACSKSGTEGL